MQGDVTRGTAADGVFKVSADAIIRNLTIRHGDVGNGSGVNLSTADSDLLLENCTVTLNNSGGGQLGGGAIYATGASSLTLIGCEVSETISTGVGAVMSWNVPTTISNCLITANSSGDGGGAVHSHSTSGELNIYNTTISDNITGGAGGAVYAYAETANIYNSTISGNVATNSGGGIYVYGADLNLINSTVYGNSSYWTNTAAGGGGIWVSGTATIKNSTIHNNSCPNGAGGGVFRHFSSQTIESTIIAGNSAALGPDYCGTGTGGISAETNNLIGDNSDSALVAGLPNANGSYIGTSGTLVDPMLDALADNGGLTETCALQLGSLAIDNGLNSDGLLYDQRGEGFDRVSKLAVDIGAFEFASGPPTGWVIFVR